MEEFNVDLELKRIEEQKAQHEISQKDIEQQSCLPTDLVVESNTQDYEDNKLVNALVNNDSAVEMAKEKYRDIKTQKGIAKKMGKVVIKKTDADIETADLKVEQQRLDNKVEKSRQKNELLKCKNERKFLKRESKQKLTLQKFKHRKEKYGDLLLRHCRKRTKNAEGKWEYLSDENGNAIINMPNSFVLFWLILFDSLVMFLNQTADIFAGLNKIVFKIFWVFLIVLILFVPPIRIWLLGLIGIKF